MNQLHKLQKIKYRVDLFIIALMFSISLSVIFKNYIGILYLLICVYIINRSFMLIMEMLLYVSSIRFVFTQFSAPDLVIYMVLCIYLSFILGTSNRIKV